MVFWDKHRYVDEVFDQKFTREYWLCIVYAVCRTGCQSLPLVQLYLLSTCTFVQEKDWLSGERCYWRKVSSTIQHPCMESNTLLFCYDLMTRNRTFELITITRLCISPKTTSLTAVQMSTWCTCHRLRTTGLMWLFRWREDLD